ncbi:MAG: FecR family protein [candidate division KSB1 bacterium]|nr:FecR family protein [candidate division KSB1 bacterium]
MLRRRKSFNFGLIVGILLFAGFSSIGLRFPSPTSAIGKINFILGREGEVTIHRANDATWISAKLKMPVAQGDQIKTAAESRCEVKLNDGSIIRIGENSLFDFEHANLSKGAKQIDASLKRGRFWANVIKLLGGQDKFEVKSPTAVCAIRGTIYRMEVDSTTRVAVYDGEVDIGPSPALQQQLQQQPRVPGPPVRIPGPTEIPGPYQITLEQWTRLVQGYQLEIRADGRYAKSQIDTTAEAPLDWIRWNKERDRLLGQ